MFHEERTVEFGVQFQCVEFDNFFYTSIRDTGNSEVGEIEELLYQQIRGKKHRGYGKVDGDMSTKN